MTYKSHELHELINTYACSEIPSNNSETVNTKTET